MFRIRKARYSSKPVIWDILGLKKNQFLVFHLNWSDTIEGAKKFEKMLAEIFSILPDMPIIFPVTSTMPTFFIDKINAPNLYLASSLEDTEISYLLYNSLAVIRAQPSISDEITIMTVTCSTNSAV